jgi:lipooligosaccharide transport system permease protein
VYKRQGFINVVLLPMNLFSGSLYPISVYPDWLEKVIMALPLWHGIALVRAFWFGDINSGVLVHIAYFVVMIAAGLFVTSRRLRALFLS